MITFPQLIKISRPRFWFYLSGSYILGVAMGLEWYLEILRTDIWLFFLLFTLPANIFLYGINDLYDRDTDAINAKKSTKEFRATEDTSKSLKNVISATIVFLLIPLFFITSYLLIAIYIVFLLLAAFYSTPPLRFKARPFLDFASNILYILPGVFGFYLVSNTPINILVTGGFFFWAFAMHLFSAIPDIEADKKVGLKTTAVVLGETRSLLLCIIFWSIFSLLLIFESKSIFSIVTLLYPLIPITILVQKKPDLIESIYWKLPLINTFLGIASYLLIAFTIV